MGRPERQERMRALRERVFAQDARQWAASFVAQLSLAGKRAQVVAREPGAGFARLVNVVSRLREGHGLILVLDYDGTLVPFADAPDRAAPDDELLEVLDALTRRPHTQVHVVSGRTRDSMAEWFGGLRVGLYAEHGIWCRPLGTAAWTMTRPVKTGWKERVRPLLEQFTAATRGTFIEEKAAGLAWHYRGASADHTDGANFGDVQARELRLLLSDLLANAPVEVLSGNKVIEVRPNGVNKGTIVPLILAGATDHSAIIAVGDDRTDEDLFEALPDGSVTVHVGDGPSAALYRLASTEEVRQLLRELAPEPRRSPGDAAKR